MSEDYLPGGLVGSGRSWPVQLDDGDTVFCANGRTMRWSGKLNQFVELRGDWRLTAQAVLAQLREIQGSAD